MYIVPKAHKSLLLAVLLGYSFSLSANTIRIGLSMPKGMAEVAYLNGMYERFANNVIRDTNDRVKVKIYYGGTLGKPDDRLNLVRRNIIQMSDASEGNYATIYRDIQVFSIPYLFPDLSTAHTILDGKIGDRMAENIRLRTGIRVLGWWESAGFKHYSSNLAIQQPDDMKGKKMRVMSAAFSVPVLAMGGTATPVPMPELYISLKTGLVDGQDNAVGVFNMLKLYEVQKNLTLDGHIYSFGPFTINDNFYESLETKDKEIIQNAAQEAIEWNRAQSYKQELDAIDKARSKGVNIYTLTKQQKMAFATITQPAAINWMKENLETPSLVEDVLGEVRRYVNP